MLKQILRLACVVTLIVSPINLIAQQSSKAATKSVTAVASNELTVLGVQTAIKAVVENPEIEASLKTRVVEAYNKALESVEAAVESKSRKDRFEKETTDLPETLKALQRDLNQPEHDLPVDVSGDASLQQLQQRLSQVETELAVAEKNLKDWQDEPKSRTDRRAAILKQQEAAKVQLAEIEQQLESKPQSDESPDLVRANRTLHEARKQSIQAESMAGQAEIRFYELAIDLLPLQRDLAARQVAQLDSLTKRLREIVNARRHHDADVQAREAKRAALEAHPALREIANRNEELANHRKVLATRIETAVQQLESVNRRATLLGEQFSKIQNRVKIARNNQSIGLLLRKQREELPNVSQEERSIRSAEEHISETSLELFDYQDNRNELATLDKSVDKVASKMNTDLSSVDQPLLRNSILEMFETQRTLLDAIVADTNSYLDKLVDLNSREQILIDNIRKFSAFCDERIMWIRSAPMIYEVSSADFWQSLRWFTNSNGWRSVLSAIAAEWKGRFWLQSFVLIVWAIALAWHNRLKRWLGALGEEAERGSCRSFGPTANAFVATILLASPWPALMAWSTVALLRDDQTQDFPRSLGESVLELSAVFACLELMRQICRRHGLAESHFSWGERSLTRIRWWLQWIMMLGLPLLLVLLMTEHQPTESVKYTLGRLAFVCFWFVLWLPSFQLTRVNGGVLAPAFQLDPNAWWSQCRRLWPAIAVSMPPILITLALAGFYYTAIQIAGRYFVTIELFLAFVIIYCALLRWILTAQRALGMQRLQARRAAAEAASTTSPAPTNTQMEIKLSDISHQTRQMLRLVSAVILSVGLWGIWSGIIPALEAARHVPLWAVATEALPGGEFRRISVTLADLAIALLILIVTLALTRNIQSLLELTFLNRLPWDAGARYAVATLTRYTVIAAGGVIIFNTLGFKWSQVQWFVAAVGVGLGFGLQEIFSNFASGIVLLFERPIRIGDLITMGNVEGKVTEIQLRATTVTDGDEREIIIPNKEFIMSRVINWTLKSTISRMTITIRVAYESSPDEVRNLLLEIARKHPSVLKEPAPQALLDEFSDSSLNFVLRVYMPNRDVYLQLRHELMTQIAEGFHQAGIVFAFPQRNIQVHFVKQSDLGSIPESPKSV